MRPGGVVAFVTSRYTMDSKDSTARKHMAERADLLGAIRLPNNAFRANAGTDVVSDIIFLQKRNRPIDHEPDWVQLGKTEDGFAINQYFVDHPEMVLGQLTTESTQYGREELTVVPIEGANLGDQLAEAVQHIEGAVYRRRGGRSRHCRGRSHPAHPACRPGGEEFLLHRGGRRGFLPGKFRDDAGGTVRHRQGACHRHGGAAADRQRPDSTSS